MATTTTEVNGLENILMPLYGVTAAVAVALNATLLISCASTRTTRLPGFQLIGSLAARDILAACGALAAFFLKDLKIFCLVNAFTG